MSPAGGVTTPLRVRAWCPDSSVSCQQGRGTRVEQVLVVGLTGGIGSGKSTVSKRLADWGAVVIDADAITHELQQPGMPVFEAMVERFGTGVVAPDGTLDRPAVAAIVFSDPDALIDLNAIVHPAVGAEIARRMALAAEPPERGGPPVVDDRRTIVVLDIPLLVESGRDDLELIIVVDCPEEMQVQRLVEHRGVAEAEARARMARQATREERLAQADVVVDNSGDLAQLEHEVGRLWDFLVEFELQTRPAR
jgi:dephospho-CoA kinase